MSPEKADPQPDAEGPAELERLDAPEIDRIDDESEFDYIPRERGGQVTVSREHIGPLPPADELHRYDDVVRGLAERIVAQWEKETEFRHRTVAAALERDREELHLRSAGIKRGQWLGFIAFSAVAIVAVVALILDRPYLSGLALLLSVAGTITHHLRGEPIEPYDDAPVPLEDPPDVNDLVEPSNRH